MTYDAAGETPAQAEAAEAPWAIPGRREAADGIRAAFADARHPGAHGGDPPSGIPSGIPSGDDICRGRSYDCQQLREWLSGRAWQELALVERVAGDLLILHSLEAPAFRYYLPALLLASLEDSEGPPRTSITEHLLGFLTPGGNATPPQAFRERMGGFTPEQAGAIRRYLAFQSARMRAFNRHLERIAPWLEPLEDVARAALDRYWVHRPAGADEV